MDKFSNGVVFPTVGFVEKVSGRKVQFDEPFVAREADNGQHVALAFELSDVGNDRAPVGVLGIERIRRPGRSWPCRNGCSGVRGLIRSRCGPCWLRLCASSHKST